MARHCFYCGRTLQDGERCSCRQRNESFQNRASDHRQEPSAHQRRQSRQNQQEQPHQQRSSQSQNQDARYRSAHTQRPPRQRPARPAFHSGKLLEYVHYLLSFLTMPADQIRNSVRFPNIQLSSILFGVSALIGGFYAAAGVNKMGVLFLPRLVLTNQTNAFLMFLKSTLLGGLMTALFNACWLVLIALLRYSPPTLSFTACCRHIPHMVLSIGDNLACTACSHRVRLVQHLFTRRIHDGKRCFFRSKPP